MRSNLLILLAGLVTVVLCCYPLTAQESRRGQGIPSHNNTNDAQVPWPNDRCSLAECYLVTMDAIGQQELALPAEIRAYCRERLFSKELNSWARNRYVRLAGRNRYQLLFEESDLATEHLKVVSDLEALLDPASFSRMKQLCTCLLLSEGKLESIFILNDLRLSEQQHRQLCQRVAKSRILKGETAIHEFEVALRYLSKDLEGIEVGTAAGELYLGKLADPADLAMADYYQYAPVTILNRPGVQRHLAMSPTRISECRVLAKKAAKRSESDASLAAHRSRNPEELLAKWRNDLDQWVSIAIGSELKPRFDQIMFQYHVRQLQPTWARKYAGAEFRVEGTFRGNKNHYQHEVTEELRFERVAESLKLLDPIIDRTKILSLCGRVVVAPFTPASKEFEPIKRRLQLSLRKQVLGANASPGPRRDDGSH